MTLTFNTKFNIGDTVYCAECYHDYCFAEHDPYTITSITTCTTESGSSMYYNITRNGVTIRCSEGWLHQTYEECTKWCEEQNK